ncbi:Bidirectional sugar transporter SWEET14 [Phytophthora ramorum]|uniref:Bidirectional sugar transporter SWEET14 n=1 Tax=Phytophthora ramorum TaxID=164328 RepID=UPI0030B7EDCD|nr:Bidirectional sugar transporter SWEET14 [Phytophthora ramorum]
MVALYVAYPPPPETELGHERARPLPVLTSASKADELSIKMAMQGPEFLPQSTSLTPLVRGEARPLLAQSYGVKVTSATDVISLAADVQEKVVGYVAVAINVCLYASPLQTMTLVLRTKSAASLPATMCCVNLVNGSLWVLYGILADDMFVLSPNALGVALSAVQVALCVKFRHSGRVEAQDDVVDTKCEALILSPVDGVALDVVKSPVYEPVRSPV